MIVSSLNGKISRYQMNIQVSYSCSMIQGPFMLLALLLACCKVVFMIEFCLHRKSNKVHELSTRSTTGKKMQENARTDARRKGLPIWKQTWF